MQRETCVMEPCVNCFLICCYHVAKAETVFLKKLEREQIRNCAKGRPGRGERKRGRPRLRLHWIGARPVAGGPARVGRTACCRPTFGWPRSRERQGLGRYPLSTQTGPAASTVRSTHHLHLRRADAHYLEGTMPASAVLGLHAASHRTCGTTP